MPAQGNIKTNRHNNYIMSKAQTLCSPFCKNELSEKAYETSKIQELASTIDLVFYS
jgi:hypothetical protein